MQAAENINIRISKEQKALIDYAAKTAGKTRTAFILEHTLRCAEEAVLDQTRFSLNDDQWKEFTDLLDQGPTQEQIEKVNELFALKAPWNQQ